MPQRNETSSTDGNINNIPAGRRYSMRLRRGNMRISRAVETENQTNIRRRRNASRERNRRSQEAEQETTLRRQRNAARERIRRSHEAEQETTSRRQRNAARVRIRRSQEAEQEVTSRRQRNAARERIRRSQEAEQETTPRRQRNAARERIRRSQEAEQETTSRRQRNAARERIRRSQEAEQEATSRRQRNAARERIRRSQETEQETIARRQQNAARMRTRRTHLPENSEFFIDFSHFNEEIIVAHNCGELNLQCRFCGAYNFKDELPVDRMFTACCRKGRIKLIKPTNELGVTLEYPNFLKDLLTKNDEITKNFRRNIRKYNSAMSFASLGADIIDLRGGGPYVFKVHGQVYHRTSHVHPLRERDRQYAQLYVIDSSEANLIRCENPANSDCLPIVFEKIDTFFREHNRLARTYKMLRDVEEDCMQNNTDGTRNISHINLVFRRDRNIDMRRFNAPQCNEIAMVFEDKDGEPPFERDFRVYPRNPINNEQQYISLNILSANLEPMVYPLFNPYGEPGWHPKLTCESYEGAQRSRVRTTITKLQYVSAQTAIRDDFNPRMSAGKLTQQWLVDSYLQIEANNLNFIRNNQRKLRSELYQGLADFIENIGQGNNGRVGIPVVLPSSFEGSPRNMKERCSDAMAIFSKYGAPDLFITFTANPKWTEITGNLKPGEEISDRPDLVCRVFRIKLKSLMSDITEKCALGRPLAHVYTIEFQKRGLPHAHILVTLVSDDKFTTPEKIDRVVSAEIPDRNSFPKLYEAVTRCMIHGPCFVNGIPGSCVENGKCKKSFPKEYCANTQHNCKGYPLYRRREGTVAFVRGSQVDNRNVVPYNAALLLKYNAHINVEVCTSLKAVKYIYKYIYKGYDCARMSLQRLNDETAQYNELTSYINGRYVCAIEAMWRILENPMHIRSHNVVRLPVHLENQQVVIFDEGREIEAFEEAMQRRTALLAYFQLNMIDQRARNFLYSQIPSHYVYVSNEWKPRKKGMSRVIGRMYQVSVKDVERFCLRILLLHVKGARSFEEIRTVNNVVYQTYKDAAIQRNLLDTDDEWDRCLLEAVTYQMPNRIRETFAYIISYNMPANIIQLWDKYADEMILDYVRNKSVEEARNMALLDINEILLQHGLSCCRVGLPEPHLSQAIQSYDSFEEEYDIDERLRTLNEAQRRAFDAIASAMESNVEENRCFYIDGPGGSGKTYLYSTLLAYVRRSQQIALPFATTGIAATLLKGGRTVHSGFKIPVPVMDNSSSTMRLNTPEANTLRMSKLIIIDEITMLTKHGLRVIDRLLQEIMDNNRPFGGKTIVIGGDFRQTLPVVLKGTRVDIIESSLLASPLWNLFKKLTLSVNMRAVGQERYNNWLLDVGLGNHQRIPGMCDDIIQIPSNMVVEDLITSVFGQNISGISVEDLSRRAILAPTNNMTLTLNTSIIEMLSGEEIVYNSVDSLISDDNNDALRYPAEFLHELMPSGMPPHTLKLKVGVLVMLLRNLNPRIGLCNGTRLIIKSLETNFITAQILSEFNNGAIVMIPRIDLMPSDVNLPFKLKRRQFPIIPAYAMTINKAQGQTFDKVGVYLDQPVFSHGQLYVALTRVREESSVKFFIQPREHQGLMTINSEKVWYTKNVVFNEVFD